MQRITHSVMLDQDKCKGCTNCIKRCPTEVIRVRQGKVFIIKMMVGYQVNHSKPIIARAVMQLDGDISKAMQKMDYPNRICDCLPGLDCGSCGAPSCRTLAEGIVRGQAVEMDCIFKLCEKVQQLAMEKVNIGSPAHGRMQTPRKENQQDDRL